MVGTIKSLCKEKGIKNMHDFEVSIGIGKNTIYRWDDLTPSIDKVAKVAEALDVSIDQIYYGHEPEAASNAASIADDELELLRIYRGLNSQGKDYLMTAAASAASNAALTKKVSDATTA